MYRCVAVLKLLSVSLNSGQAVDYWQQRRAIRQHDVSMMLLCMIVKPVGLVDRIQMRKTDCFGKTRFVPHVPSSL